MDHDGYGHSGSSGNNSDIASGVEDLKAAIPVVAEGDRRSSKMHFYGTSSGAIRAGAYAQAQPERVGPAGPVRLHLQGHRLAGDRPARARVEELRAKHSAQARRRDDPLDLHPRRPCLGATTRRCRRRSSPQEMKFGDTIPTGTYLDMAANLPLVDPKKVLSPVLMIRGDHDGNSTNEDLLDFYQRLPNGDRQFVILPHTAHSPGYSNNRHLLCYAVKNFLASPAAVQS